jgi:hypothetical protein
MHPSGWKVLLFIHTKTSIFSFFLLSPCMLACVLIYVVCFVTSLVHLSSGLNCRQLFWWLSIILIMCHPHNFLCTFCRICSSQRKVKNVKILCFLKRGKIHSFIFW